MLEKMKGLLKSKDGEVLVTIFGRVIITAIILLFVIETFALIMHKQDIDYISKQLAKTIEQDGYVSADVNTYLNEMNESLGTNATYRVVFDDGICRKPSAPSNAIQFRDEFTVVVSDTHEWVVASPIGTEEDVKFVIDITSDVSGRSEVYWK